MTRGGARSGPTIAARLGAAMLMLALGLGALPELARAGDPPATSARSLMLPLAQPAWSDLTPQQRKVLAPLEGQWNAMPLAKRRAWMSLATRIPAMDAGQREKAQERILEWASLTPEQRTQARNNYRLAKTLPKDERAASWEQYRQMTPEQRSVLRLSGWTSNTAARHAGAATGLAKQAARPLPGVVPPPPRNGAVLAPGPEGAGAPASGVPAASPSVPGTEPGAAPADAAAGASSGGSGGTQEAAASTGATATATTPSSSAGPTGPATGDTPTPQAASRSQ